MKIGYVVNAYRKARGWSQIEFANLIKSDQSYVSKLERDRLSPSLNVAKTIADVFGVTVDELMKAAPTEAHS